MRIIAGFLKGHRLYFPQNRNIRPLKDRARESIFNILMHSKKISFCLMGSHILDLYAGTGSFGSPNPSSPPVGVPSPPPPSGGSIASLYAFHF